VLLAHVLGIDGAEIECIVRTGAAVAMCPITAAEARTRRLGVVKHHSCPNYG
jgi:cytosine/adenosine deaminase-related metal-dependent hydrolase